MVHLGFQEKRNSMDRGRTGSVLEESNFEKCWLVVSLLRAEILLSVQMMRLEWLLL